MALGFLKYGFGAMANNLANPPVVGNIGTPAITSGATANTKGTYQTLHASTPYDCYGFSLAIVNVFTAGAAINMLVDIAVGAAAAERVIVPNVLAGASGNATQGAYAPFFPIFIPKGTRISARSQDSVGSKIVSVAVFLHGGGVPPWPVFTACENYGAVTATSKGLAHTAGTSAESTWTNVGSVTGRQIGAILPMIQSDTVAALNALAYAMELGIASTLLAEYYFSTTTSEAVNSLLPTMPHFCKIPASTQMMIRCMCGGTGQSLQYGILGFY